jgi:hypothetical protein
MQRDLRVPLARSISLRRPVPAEVLTSLAHDTNSLVASAADIRAVGSGSFGSTKVDVLGLPGAGPETSVCVRYRPRQ